MNSFQNRSSETSLCRPIVRVLLALSTFGAISACAAEVVPADAAEADELVADHLAAIGLGDRELAIDGDVIVVDGDMILSRTALLAGEYGPFFDEEVDEDGLVEKGYRYSTVVSAANRGNLKLVWATGGRAPSTRIKDAFVAAAAAWGAIPNSTLRISTTNTGPTITVNMISGLSWPPLVNGVTVKGCTGVDACAEIPASGKPGANVYVKTRADTSGCLDWTTSYLAAVARHELGHTVGFAHPKESGSTWISGTASCSGTAASCLGSPGYTTIMKKVTLSASCVTADTRLTQDDYASAAAIY